MRWLGLGVAVSTQMRSYLLAAFVVGYATATLASQGPGVRPGTASFLEQSCAAAIVAALGALIVVGLLRYFCGWSLISKG